jgi:5,10-methylenetetrahydromethanopterin reductase
VPRRLPGGAERAGHDWTRLDLARVTEAFKKGEVQRALELTPPEVGDALSVAGTPQDWIRWIEGDLAPADFGHLLVTFADPFLVETWAGISIEGLPTLEEQLQLFHDALRISPQPA